MASDANNGNNNGVWHKTSVQAARQQTYSAAEVSTLFAPQTTIAAPTTFAVGIKRAQAQAQAQAQPPTSSQTQQPPLGPPPKRLATGPPPIRPTKLMASPIAAVVDPKEDQDIDLPSWLPEGVSEYSQRRVMNATPTVAQDPLLSLAHPIYSLPAQIVDNFESMGIRSIYPWQKQCLLAGSPTPPGHGSDLLDGSRNLVYAAPTGGGKSLVADVLMLKRVLAMPTTQQQPGALRRRPKALLVLPFVALVQEKVRWLRRVVQGVGGDLPGGPGAGLGTGPGGDSLRVVGFFGGAKIRATWGDFDIGVATIEKANALINTAIDECTIGDLSVVVLDELHMIDDAHRGYLLELLATKLLCLDHHVQIVGMSATLNVSSDTCAWLPPSTDADLAEHSTAVPVAGRLLLPDTLPAYPHRGAYRV